MDEELGFILYQTLSDSLTTLQSTSMGFGMIVHGFHMPRNRLWTNSMGSSEKHAVSSHAALIPIGW